jgi:hypothetical protein
VLRRIAQAGSSGLSAMVNGTVPPDSPQSTPDGDGPAVAAAEQASPASDTLTVSALSYSAR